MTDPFDTTAPSIDLAQFTSDIAQMRAQLEGPLVSSANKAGQAIEAGLLGAVRSGKLGFEDLGKTALTVLSQIASAAVGGSGGLAGFASSLFGTGSGAAGRATGGPVSPGTAYLVGERGPELFVPTSSGQVVTGGQPAQRDVHVSITVNGNGQDAPKALARSARQVARAVRGALAD